MSYSETLAETDDRRVRIEIDEYADEPYDDGQSPVLRISYERGYWHGEHVDHSGRPHDCDLSIEEAAQRWDIDSPMFAKYLRAYHGVTEIVTYRSQDYAYVTYDSADWREYTGAPMGHANLDEYKAWCEGDVWGWVIERKETWHAETDPEITMITWETEDSCGGYYGREWAVENALEHFRYTIRDLGDGTVVSAE